jgi:hypothetical protein
MVLIPTSLAEFTPECSRNRVQHDPKRLVDVGHVELKPIVPQVFSIVKIF